MKKIELSDALERVFSDRRRAVSGALDFTMMYAIQEGEAADLAVYESDGCLVFVDDHDIEGKRFLNRTLYPMTPDADPVGLALRLEAEEKGTLAPGVVVTVPEGEDSLGEELDRLPGWRQFVRVGQRFTETPRDCRIDGRTIRALTPDDREALSAFCSVNDPSPYAKNVYENFLRIFEEGINPYRREGCCLGAWDGDTLTGAVDTFSFNMGRFQKRAPTAFVADLAVAPAYRRRGIGRALIKAALSLYPEEWYAYQAARGNEPSMAAARSAGFSFLGAMLWVR